MSGFNTYSEYKNSASSEKIILATLNASKRLVAWTLHSGSIYKKTSQDYSVMESLKSDGISLTQVYILSDVTAGKYFNDTTNDILYVRLSDSGNPNSHFITLTFKLFYSNIPVDAPHDLSTGFDVHWEPMIETTSEFTTEVDTINQQGMSIEGKGNLTLYNDQDFWPSNFDKLFFDNQECLIYSWNKNLEITSAKLIFKGKIESKSYSPEKITFTLKDLISSLRDVPSLSNISTLVTSGYRPLPSHYNAKKRMVFGRVQGFRPTNIDQIINSRYPLTGTVLATNSSTTITGTSTLFMSELNPEDRIDIDGFIYTIASITSNTSAELTETFAQSTTSSAARNFLPKWPKLFINREWCLAGHALSQPEMHVQAGSNTNLLLVENTEDFYDGDYIYIGTLGSGELVQVETVVNSRLLRLSQSLGTFPAVGTIVTRFCVQNFQIDDNELLPYRDFTVDPDTAILTIRDTAEYNAGSIISTAGNGEFTNGLNSVVAQPSGTGSFKTLFKPGDLVRPYGQSTWYQIMSIIDDDNIKLTTLFAGSSTGGSGAQMQKKEVLIKNSDNIVTCTLYGRTDDDTSTGNLIKTTPKIISILLTDIGLLSDLESTTFTNSEPFAPAEVYLTIPSTYENTYVRNYRDIINDLNQSNFGMIYQTDNFKIAFGLLKPNYNSSITKFRESDIINLEVENTNKNMIKTATVNYLYKEYDTNSLEKSFASVDSVSDIASYITNNSREKTIVTNLINEVDAQRLADRWKFLLEYSTNVIKFKTKLQGIEVNINDIIEVDHRKLFDRFGSSSTRRLMLVQRVSRIFNGVEIEAVDLSNAFSRVAKYADTTIGTWTLSSVDDKLENGFISDTNEMINDEEDSFFVNRIW